MPRQTGLRAWLRVQRKDATSCSRSSRLLTAVLYSVSFAALGLCIASLGPALLELAIQTGSTLQYAGYCFGARSLGYLLGSFAGPAFDRFNGHMIMSLALVLAGAGSFCTPFVRNVVVLGAVCTMQGVGMGISDSGCNVLLIYLFQAPPAAREPDAGADSAASQKAEQDQDDEVIVTNAAGEPVGFQPWMQFMHFSFALGAFMTPLFMAASHAGRTDVNSENAQDEAANAYKGTFVTIGVVCLLLAIWFLIMVAPKPRGPATDPATSHADAQRTIERTNLAASTVVADASIDWQPLDATTAADGAPNVAAAAPAISSTSPSTTAATAAAQSAALRRQRWIVVLGTATLLGVYVGCEAGMHMCCTLRSVVLRCNPCAQHSIHALHLTSPPHHSLLILAHHFHVLTGYGSYITAYSVLQLGMSEYAGQLMTSLYWGAIMVGRFAAVPMSFYIPVEKSLGVSMLGAFISALFLLLGRNSAPMVWIGSIVFGLFMACIFPSAIALTETYFPLHGTFTTTFVIGAATGEWALPFMITSLFGNAECVNEECRAAAQDKFGPTVVMWIIAVGSAVNVGLFFFLRKQGRGVSAMLTAQEQQARSDATATAAAPVSV